MTDRDFWIAVRAALLLFVDAIERRYSLGKHGGNSFARIAEQSDKNAHELTPKLG